MTESSDYSIEAKNLTCRYGRCVALDRLNFAIEGPTVLGLVGKNGSGKSTLLRLLCGWEKPTDGMITIAGSVPYDTRKVLKDILFLDEKVEFDFTLTLAGILDKCAFMDERFDLLYAHDVAAQFSLNLKKRYAQLSKGMKNQFGIIVALAFNRPITVMDEPVSGLDEGARKLFYSLLVKSQIHNPRIFVVSTHLLGEFEQYADTFMVLRDGRIAAYDKRETFETLFIQVSGQSEYVERAIEGLEICKIKEFAGMRNVTVPNLMDHERKRFAEQHNVDIRHVSVNEACVILGGL